MSLNLTPTIHSIPSYDRRSWISPDHQLNTLIPPIDKAIKESIPSIGDLANIIREYTTDEWTTNWYKALKELGSLPERIPPLPENIHEIMDSECPIYGKGYQVKDTHFLQLIPEELKNLWHLEYQILRPYAKQKADKQSLRFREFPSATYDEQRDVRFPPSHWILMPKEILPESRNKNWYEHIKSIETLSQKSLPKYEIPTLQQFFAATSLHGVATDEKSSYATIQTDKGIRQTFTRVKDLINQHDGLIVGGLTSSGFCVSTGAYASRFDTEHIGITPICRL